MLTIQTLRHCVSPTSITPHLIRADSCDSWTSSWWDRLPACHCIQFASHSRQSRANHSRSSKLPQIHTPHQCPSVAPIFVRADSCDSWTSLVGQASSLSLHFNSRTVRVIRGPTTPAVRNTHRSIHLISTHPWLLSSFVPIRVIRGRPWWARLPACHCIQFASHSRQSRANHSRSSAPQIHTPHLCQSCGFSRHHNPPPFISFTTVLQTLAA